MFSSKQKVILAFALFSTIPLGMASPPPNIYISPSNPEAGEQVTIRADTGDAESFIWNIEGGGGYLTGSSVTNTWNEPGDYNVEVTGYITQTDLVENSKTVTVSAASDDGGSDGDDGDGGNEDDGNNDGGDNTNLQADFSYEQVDGGQRPADKIRFDASVSGGSGDIEYSWDIEDGQNSGIYTKRSGGEAATYDFDQGIDYTVELTAEDGNGNTDSVSKDIKVICNSEENAVVSEDPYLGMDDKGKASCGSDFRVRTNKPSEKNGEIQLDALVCNVPEGGATLNFYYWEVPLFSSEQAQSKTVSLNSGDNRIKTTVSARSGTLYRSHAEVNDAYNWEQSTTSIETSGRRPPSSPDPRCVLNSESSSDIDGSNPDYGDGDGGDDESGDDDSGNNDGDDGGNEDGDQNSPKIERIYLPDSVKTGESVSFSVMVSGFGSDKSFTWKVDGEEINSPTGYTFEEPGDHVITVTVSDSSGNEISQSRTLSVEANNPAGEVELPSYVLRQDQGTEAEITISNSGKYRLDVFYKEKYDSKSRRKVQTVEGIEKSQKKDIRIPGKGVIITELIAPGTWWNPLDNDKVISSSQRRVGYTEIEGKRLDLNADGKIGRKDYGLYIQNVEVGPFQYPHRRAKLDYNCDKQTGYQDKARLLRYIMGKEDITQCEYQEQPEATVKVNGLTDQGAVKATYSASKAGEYQIQYEVNGETVHNSRVTVDNPGRKKVSVQPLDVNNGDVVTVKIGRQGVDNILDKAEKTIEMKAQVKIAKAPTDEGYVKTEYTASSPGSYKINYYVNGELVKTEQANVQVAGRKYTYKEPVELHNQDNLKVKLGSEGQVLDEAEKTIEITGKVKLADEKLKENPLKLQYSSSITGEHRILLKVNGETVSTEQVDIEKTDKVYSYRQEMDLKSGDNLEIKFGRDSSVLDQVSKTVEGVGRVSCTYDLFGKVENSLQSDVPRDQKKVFAGDRFTTITAEGTFGWTVTADCGSKINLIYREAGEKLAEKEVKLPEQGGKVDGITLKADGSNGGDQADGEVSFQSDSYSPGNTVTVEYSGTRQGSHKLVFSINGEEVHNMGVGLPSTGTSFTQSQDLNTEAGDTVKVELFRNPVGSEKIKLDEATASIKQSLQPEISVSPDSIDSGSTVEFKGYPAGDYTYSWDLDNNGQYEEQGRTVYHEFTESGEKTVKLKISGQGSEAVRERTVNVQQPDISSNLQVSKEEITRDERLQIEYTTSQDVALNGYKVVVKSPSGEKVVKKNSESQSGSTTFTPGSDAETGTYTAKLVAKEGFLSSIIRTIFGPEAQKEFKVVKASNNLAKWQERCKEKGYDPTTASGRAKCIEEDIAPSCFKENPGSECIEIADTVCDYYLGTEFNPETGKCGGR